MSKIFITGMAGFVGSSLAHALSEEHDVTGIDNMSYGHESNLIRNGKRLTGFQIADARDRSIQGLLKDVDVVFHFAGIAPLPDNQVNPQECVSNNIESTANILELSRRAGVKQFILSSTSAVYENSKQEFLSESDDGSPDLMYAVSKQCAERITKSFQSCYGLPTTILRFFNVYGPHQDFVRQSPPLMGYIVREFLNGRQPILHSDGTQERDYVHVDDVLSMCNTVMMNSRAYGKTLNVCSGETHSVREILEICIGVMGNNNSAKFRDSEKLWDAYESLFSGTYPMSKNRIKKETEKFSRGDSSFSMSAVGWSTKIPFREGVTSTVKQMIEIIEKGKN
jgi:nucleoside-diphosphate-sugar epimerase